MKHARSGQSALLARRLTGQFDPVAIHHALERREVRPLLFRRTGARTLIVADAALQLEAIGCDATLTAQSEG
ncbi:MAG TPA: hypothetical protein VHM21_03405, partial [Sphingomicrobium sp.]|nr:hypothetical protein [Sphingomicrobium sp.]